MSKATGIPATTIYHALERGLDNTTTRIRTQIEYALLELPSDDAGANVDALSDDERELLNGYRSLSVRGKQALLAGLREYSKGE